MSNSITVAVSDAGSFELPAASHLTSIAHSAIQPDVFDQQGNWYRLIKLGESLVALKAMPTGTLTWSSPNSIRAVDVQREVERIFSLISLPDKALEHLPARLAKQFIDLAPLVHIASPTLGEALIKGIIRQVISAGQAKKLLQQFVTCFGSYYHYANLTLYNFPTLERIIQLSSEELLACGFGFKAKVVKRVASQLLEGQFEQQVLRCSPSEAVQLLQQLKGIGPWTAHVAICDFLHDWSQYPFSDLAVRKWARGLWPEQSWPEHEDEFGYAWQQTNGEYTALITFYLLTLGKMVVI